MAELRNVFADAAASIFLTPIGAVTCALRSGLTLLEGAVHASEAFHAYAEGRHREAPEGTLEVTQALAEVYRLEVNALRGDVTRLVRERDRAEQWRDDQRDAIKAVMADNAKLVEQRDSLADRVTAAEALAASQSAEILRLRGAIGQRDVTLAAYEAELERLRAIAEAANAFGRAAADHA